MSAETAAKARLLASMHAPGERVKTRVRSGLGVELTLEDSRVVLDAGSMSSCLLGHCHPEVVAAIEKAARTVYVGDATGYAPRERAADDLLRLAFASEPWADTVAFFVSSSEAADLGLLLAQMLTGREPLVSRELSYHGGVGLGREISNHPLWGAHLAGLERGIIPRPFKLAETRELPVPACGVDPAPQNHLCTASCLKDAARALDGAAAVMIDYSQGGVCPSAQYQDTLATLAREAGTLWIADETVTAFGRMGHNFAFQRGSSRPDLVTLGKGLTAGSAPAGALILSRDVIDAIGRRRWLTSGTYRGNPLTVAAISAVQHVIERDGLVARAAELGTRLGADLRSLATRHPSVEAVIGEGLMWIVRLAGAADHAEDRWRGDGSTTPPTTLVHEAALREGVFIGVLGGGCLWLIPPLVVTTKQLARAVDALDVALGVADRAVT
jgi:4-aminobutyrate aminotransferase-like enzyme